MPEFIYTNFGRTTLAANVAAGATTMTVQENDAYKFPSPDNTYDEVFSCILFTPDQTEIEIVYCTARVENTFTVERGKESTADRAWPEGTLLIHNMTAQIFTDIVDAGPRQQDVIIALSNSGGATGNKIMTSVNGTTWTMRTTPGATDQWLGGAARPASAGTPLIVLVGDGSGNSIATSSDAGVSWTAQTPPDSRDWLDVAYSPTLDLFVAVSNDTTGSNQVMTSPDGVAWTLRTVPTTSSTYGNILWSKSHSLFVITAISGGDVLTSPDGVNWTHNASGVTGMGKMAEDTVTGEIACNNRGDITCPNCTDPTAAWNLYAAGWTAGMSDIAYSPSLDLWVVISTVAPRESSSSSPTSAWSNTTNSDNSNSWEGLVWAPELLLFVAVSGDNTNTPGKGIQTSPDGVNWTEQDTPASMDAETFNHIFLADLKSG